VALKLSWTFGFVLMIRGNYSKGFLEASIHASKPVKTFWREGFQSFPRGIRHETDSVKCYPKEAASCCQVEAFYRRDGLTAREKFL